MSGTGCIGCGISTGMCTDPNRHGLDVSRGEGGPEAARRLLLITAAVVLVLVYVAVTFAAMHRPI
ncbi:hypothetical protein [Streptomyces sp. NBC_01363]|uniref:hypothetical protein n=1 Tax=Streptomyces sp. NBC_01363 TaxID=2903840 RepID=UPI002257B952|nr:hypothetical protein [Streptomyces sp. NBC_01363]MCX4734301.1 hypothetical protein [Streptomyces sp. NBC_01363]